MERVRSVLRHTQCEMVTRRSHSSFKNATGSSVSAVSSNVLGVIASRLARDFLAIGFSPKLEGVNCPSDRNSIALRWRRCRPSAKELGSPTCHALFFR